MVVELDTKKNHREQERTQTDLSADEEGGCWPNPIQLFFMIPLLIFLQGQMHAHAQAHTHT